MRVAGSNPVFRSRNLAFGREGDRRRNGTEPPRSPRPTEQQAGRAAPTDRTPPEKRGGGDARKRGGGALGGNAQPIGLALSMNEQTTNPAARATRTQMKTSRVSMAALHVRLTD